MERMPRIQGGVQDVGRMSTLAKRQLDRVLFVRVTTAKIPFIKLESVAKE